jgi:very-short-patch-repair endonuclease
MRQGMTDAERALWRRLRRDQLGVRFRRQHPVGPYVTDFACRSLRLIVEVDGGQHAIRSDRDQRRNAWMADRGFLVLRFWNHDVLGNLDGVVERIHAEVIRLRATVAAVHEEEAEP